MIEFKKFLGKNAKECYILVKGFGLSYHCLLSIHLIRDCKVHSEKTCGKDGCSAHHHPLLHRDDSINCAFEDYISDVESEVETPLTSLSVQANHVVKNGWTSINILVCSVNAQNKLKQTSVITLLDGGSNVTCIYADLALELKLPFIRTENKTVQYMIQTTTITSNEVQFELVSQSDLSIITVRGWTVINLAIKSGCIDWFPDRKKFEYYQNPVESQY